MRPSFNVWWPEVVATIGAAEVASNARSYLGAKEKCWQVLGGPVGALSPDEIVWCRYAIAYINKRFVRLPACRAEDVDGYLSEAVEQLRQAVMLAPDNAEVHALLGGVYGAQVSFGKGYALATMSAASFERAVRLDPGNPRVPLAQGIGALHTPERYGGGLLKAEALLRRATALFAREPIDRPWPNWGRLDLHVWLGHLLSLRGDRDAARAEFVKALGLAPDFAWVKYRLLPALDSGGVMPRPETVMP